MSLNNQQHAAAMQVDEQKSSSAAAAAPMASTPARARARSPAPKKKMLIKPFKVAPKPPEAFAEDTLKNLSLAVEAVYQQRHSQFSQEELYRSVESLCNLGKAADVYARLSSLCQEHISGVLQTLADQTQRDADEHSHMQLGSPHAAAAASSPTAASVSSLSLPLLQQLHVIWTSHCQEMLTIRGIFLFLDRTYVMQQAAAVHVPHNNSNSASGNSFDAPDTKRPPGSLWEMGLNFFCEQLQKHSAVESRVLSGLLTLIEKERLGERIDRSLLKSLLRMLSALRLYAHTFEPSFLSSTAAFYAAASRKAIASELSVGEYVHFIQQRLLQEDERALAYLDEATREPLTRSLEQELIAAHADHLLGNTFTQLLDSKRTQELSIMYQLFARIRQLPLMRSAFEVYVKQTAGRIVATGCVNPDDAKAAEAKAAAAGASAAAADSSSASAIAASSSSAPAPAASPQPSLPPSTPATMVLDLLRLKVTLDEVLSFSFSSDAEFIKGLKLAFENAINSVDNTPAELVAKFIDRVLRTGGKGIRITPLAGAGAGSSTAGVADSATGMEDVNNASALSALPSASAASASAAAAASSASVGSAEVESLLEHVMFLFRYLSGKDVFQAFYRRDVAKRLLLHKSASLDSEKSMISRIKAECGASFTAKLEGMFKDMELSKDLQKEYEIHMATQIAAGGGGGMGADTAMKVEGDASSSSSSSSAAPSAASSAESAAPELSVHVLTTGSWPAYNPVECTLPGPIARLHEEFKLFYLHKHSGRKLLWHHSLGTAVLRAHFPRGRRELAVSALQAVVLMLFNDHIRLTLDEITRYSGITDAMEVKRTLASLALSDDVRVLLKEPRNKKLLPTDVFFLNTEFSSKLFRIKINSVQLKETKEEHAATSTRVLEDRQYALDACIVRVMKSRKTLAHNQLMAEVLSQTKFPTRPPDVKKRIASLIEREYMERDKNDSSVYLYMA